MELEILLVLGLPILGSLLLALLGAWRFAPELNVGVSLTTLAASAFLVVRVIRYGAAPAWHESFLSTLSMSFWLL